MQNIGFIGLGAMGSEMAPLLSKAGYNVFGFDIKKKIDENTGVVNVENIESLIDKDVIIYMLPDGKIVSKVTESLISYGSKSIMVDMSSSHPDDTLALGKKLKEKRDIKFEKHLKIFYKNMIKRLNKQVVNKTYDELGLQNLLYCFKYLPEP